MGWPTISRPAAYATHPRWRERWAATQAQRGGRPTVRAMTQEPTSSLRPYLGNARRGDVDMIARSLEQHGQYKPIVVNKGTKAPNLERTILAGNHTWEAAKQLGWEQIDVHWVDVDKHQARDIVLIDNKANDSASYDVDALVDMLTEYPDLSVLGSPATNSTRYWNHWTLRPRMTRRTCPPTRNPPSGTSLWSAPRRMKRNS